MSSLSPPWARLRLQPGTESWPATQSSK
ncbi:hypothetical protein CMEL01_00422 [Colletotrichum melonis]|nr:hypothetical protein CMEL01_00422 [Colletotrichum melonis]